MSTDKVMAAVSALVETTVVSTIEDLAKYLSTKLDFDDDMVQFFEEFKTLRLSTLKEEAKQNKKSSKRSKSTEEKAPRKKSVYNVFIKERLAELKQLPSNELEKRLEVLFENKPELRSKALGKQLLALASSEYSKSDHKVDVVETDEEVVEKVVEPVVKSDVDTKTKSTKTKKTKA